MPDNPVLSSRFPVPLRPEIEALETSGIMELWQMGFGREDLIPFWVGEGDRPTPDFICEAAAAGLAAGQTFYTHKRGIPELRTALAGYLDGLLGLDSSPGGRIAFERVTVTGSGMNGIMLCLQVMVGQGDNVAVVTPVWPNILSAIQIAGGVVRPVGLDSLPEGGFRLDLDKLIDSLDERSKAVFIATPGNPTGWVMPREQQEALLAVCRERGIWLISDEVYQRFVYDRPSAKRPASPSILQIAKPEDPVLVANSFSKAWAMTGWRYGWIVHPASLAETFGQLVEYNTSGGQEFLQRGCLAAIEEGDAFVQEQVERCGRGAELVFQRLSGLPRVRIARPEGAFYAFFAAEGVENSLDFAKQVLAESGVGLAPGSAFGPGGEGHLRLCFAGSTDRLAEGLERLAPLLA